MPADIGPGDLVRIGADKDSRIVSCYRYVKFNKRTQKPERGEYMRYTIMDVNGFGGQYHYRFGIAYKSPDGKKVYFCNDGQLRDFNKIVDICEADKYSNVMKFNRETKKWVQGSYDDIVCYEDSPATASYISMKTLYLNQERVMYIYEMN